MVAPLPPKPTSINLLDSGLALCRHFILPGSHSSFVFLAWFGLAEFLFASETIAYRESFFTIGLAVTMMSFVSLALSLSRNVTPDATQVGVERRHGSKNRYWKKI